MGATEEESLWARFASSGEWRLRVGRSGSLVGSLVLAVDVSGPAEVLGFRRDMVGRSGSSAGVVLEVEAVLVVFVVDVSVPELLPELS